MPTNSDGYINNNANLTSRQAVTNNINYANHLLDRTGRGFRFNLTEIQDVSGASGFFNLPARSEANKVSLEAAATTSAASRAQFFWRDDAINVYINDTSSGVCSFVGSGNMVFTGSAAETRLKARALDGGLEDCELSFESGERLQGRFLIARLDYSGDFNGERSYAVSLESSGPVVSL